MNEQQIKSLILQFGKRALDDYQNENVVTLTAQRADNYRSLLSGYSALLEERLGELEVEKAQRWAEIREKSKSNSDAENLWNATGSGLEYIKLKSLMKAVDKIRAACKDRLDRLQNESFNRY